MSGWVWVHSKNCFHSNWQAVCWDGAGADSMGAAGWAATGASDPPPKEPVKACPTVCP